MNKDDLLKLREQLANDKFTRISTENLPKDYIVVWDKSGQAEIEDCPIYSGDYILNNKKSASEVVDTLVHNYAQAIYSFQQNGIDDGWAPIMSVDVSLIYKYDQKLVKQDEEVDEDFVVVPEGTETLGDMVRLTNSYEYSEEGYNGVPNTCLPWRFGLEKSKNVKDLIKNKPLGEECFVSFNELLTELSSRGFYTDCEDFQTVEKLQTWVLSYAIEPIELIEGKCMEADQCTIQDEIKKTI